MTYDVLRSQSASDFGVVAVCLESDDALDTLAMDLEVPLSGAPFFYLVRSENDGPGDGSLGIDSAGMQRVGRGLGLAGVATRGATRIRAIHRCVAVTIPAAVLQVRVA